MEKIKKSIDLFLEDKYKVVLFIILIFLSIFSIYFLRPQIAGDSLLYTSSIEVLQAGVEPVGFIPMMILTTFLGLKLIMFFNFFTNNIALSWIFLDIILYIPMGLFFYSLLKRIMGDTQVAFLGTLFLVTNYAAVTFGLGFLMDIGGWTAYIASLYFSSRFLESGENKWLYISSLVVGIGGLYKEYSFVAYVIIFGLILWKDWKNWGDIFKKVFISGFLAFFPFLLMNIYTYYNFNGYTYLDWFGHNQVHYTYQNRLVEFIKSFGSIYNFGWFLFFPGLYILLKRYREIIKDKNLVFISLVLLSCFSVLAWPVVTRVLFITMPGVILVSCLFIRKLNSKWWVVTPILILYVISAYLMDSFILNFVNLPF